MRIPIVPLEARISLEVPLDQLIWSPNNASIRAANEQLPSPIPSFKVDLPVSTCPAAGFVTYLVGVYGPPPRSW
jgi:hypothetical protein